MAEVSYEETGETPKQDSGSKEAKLAEIQKKINELTAERDKLMRE